MRRLELVMLIGMLAAGMVQGCAMTPAERDAALHAWAERDAERERECVRARGQWVANGCVFRGGS